MRLRNATLLSSTLALLALLTVGCGGTEGPGASGKITLGEGIDTTDLKTLEIRAAPDGDLSFSPQMPRYPKEAAGDLWDESLILAAITFPYEYEVGTPLGTTEYKRYRIVAWLSKEGGGETPASGEKYGTNSFELTECGEPLGDYCRVTLEVNFTIEQTAP